MRVQALIAYVICASLLGACVYVPPFWDAHDAVYKAMGFEKGTTIKTEVLENLGEPTSRDEDLNMFYLQGA